MIKIALKHFIYEKCIDTLFNAITRNFSIVKKGTKVKLPKYLQDIFNEGAMYVPNSVEFVHYKHIFKTHTSYEYNIGWLVDSYAINDLEILALKLANRIERKLLADAEYQLKKLKDFSDK